MEKDFFNKSTIEVAKSLLGCYLVHGKTTGKIVETEAYLEDDPASHSFKGKTKRNSPMFNKAGTAYVYFTYGMHNCFNVVTNVKGKGEAVLIRSLEPTKGIGLMKKRRCTENIRNLCNGPAKLVQAMAISIKHNNTDLINGNLKILSRNKKENFEIVQSKRIGIKKGSELQYRFYIKGNKFVSKK
jgi:DNA-3-methyladenine glycosylase